MCHLQSVQAMALSIETQIGIEIIWSISSRITIYHVHRQREWFGLRQNHKMNKNHTHFGSWQTNADTQHKREEIYDTKTTNIL